jgi:hypothetical protein
LFSANFSQEQGNVISKQITKITHQLTLTLSPVSTSEWAGKWIMDSENMATWQNTTTTVHWQTLSGTTPRYVNDYVFDLEDLASLFRGKGTKSSRLAFQTEDPWTMEA